MRSRLVVSALLAALPLASGVVVMALILNPGVPFGASLPAIAVALFLPYLVFGTAALLALAGTFGIVAWWPRALRPPLERLPWFTSLCFFSVTATATLFWVNRLAYEDSIPLDSVAALGSSAVALLAIAALLGGVGGALLAFPYRRHGSVPPLIVLAYGAALALPLAARPSPVTGVPPAPLSTEPIAPVRRVTLIGIDGLGAEAVRAGVAEERLPVFSRLIRRGAFASLATLSPTEGPPVWTSIVTGRSPRAHGVKSFVEYRLLREGPVFELLPRGIFVRGLERAGLVTRTPVSSSSRRRRALWQVLNAFGIQAGVVRFWGTHPPEHVSGFMLSNYFHLLAADPVRARESLYPADLADEVRARLVAAGEVTSEASRFVDASVVGARDDVLERELLERALARDLSYKRAGDVLRAAYQPAFFATYFFGADVVGHAFTRHARPEGFGDVTPEEARRYGAVIDRYAAQLGAWIEEVHAALAPDEVLLVVSGYGMRPLPLWRQVIQQLLGGSAMSGTHAGAPDGFLIAVGEGIEPGTELLGASVLDVAPTVLYLMGLPVARDMEGLVLTGMLDARFASRHPVTYIPSYESLAVTAPPPARAELPPLEEEDPAR